MQRKFILLKYAAIAILLISFASVTYWLFTTGTKEIITETVSIEIPHGEKKAELILSNGQSIQLYPSSKNILKEVDGTVIANDSVSLTYEGLEKNNTKKAKEILYNTLNIARGGEYFLILNDGTKVWVNSLSSLKYPVVFTGKERVVELISGEAYFEVVSDPNRPFIVKNNNYNINVLGTSFNISCYNEENAVTTLVEGSVKISNVTGNESQDFNILANDQFTFNKSKQSIKIQKVDAKAFSSWVDGNFSFENETLEKIFQKLERWYNIDVSFATDKAKLYEFTGMLPRFENFEVILEMLEIIGEVEFTVDGNKVFIDVK